MYLSTKLQKMYLSTTTDTQIVQKCTARTCITVSKIFDHFHTWEIQCNIQHNDKAFIGLFH